MHIKGTKRHGQNYENAIPTMPKHTGNLAYAEACSPQPIDKINQYTQQSQIQTSLEILQQIQIWQGKKETAQ